MLEATVLYTNFGSAKWSGFWSLSVPTILSFHSSSFKYLNWRGWKSSFTLTLSIRTVDDAVSFLIVIKCEIIGDVVGACVVGAWVVGF